MSKLRLLCPLLALLSCAACNDDEPLATTGTTDVEVTFAGMVGTEPLAIESKTYEAPGVAEGFRLSRVSFFLSGIQLLSDAGQGELVTDVAEVAYLELGSDGKATLQLKDVPQGNYTGIEFNLGLTPAQDALQPKDFAPGTPLANTSEYWVDWGSYVFLKIEGRSDTLADGRARFDQNFVYHVGKAAENTKRITVRTPLEIDGSAANLPLRVDVAQILGLRGNDPVSLVGAADHKNTAATRLMTNATSAFTRDR